MLSRRLFLAITSSAVAAPAISWGASTVPTLLDHILLGCSDLDAGIAFVEQHTGLRAAFGGVHPGRGTRNALLSLGEPGREELNPRRYLEIIAPDPAQTGASDTYGLQRLTEPRLVTWAAHPGDLDQFAARLRAANIAFDGPTAGSRKRPDGRLLKWRTISLRDNPGLLPFFIEWSADTTHPSVDAPRGCHLERFEILTPDSGALIETANQLGLDVVIAKAAKPQIHAVIRCADKEMLLTS
jgi:catechol 2,3-dioxygenase-like lactoylglutathione lyase family enzyme